MSRFLALSPHGGGGRPLRAPARPIPAPITHTSGRSRSSVAQTSSRFVSARMFTSAPPPRRSARSLTCAADSSPVTRRTRRSALSERRAMRSSVDLPIPGSPLTRTRLAGTSPPPSTRSSSVTPVGIRSASVASTSTRRSSGRPAGAVFPLGAAAIRSSTSVPQLPQAGHLPSHLPVVYPHSEQACWMAAAFAMGDPW
jgi:hypothetical protein